MFSLNFSIFTQPLQKWLIASTSRIRPVATDMAATAPFREEKPRLCQVPSMETPVSTISSWSLSQWFSFRISSEASHDCFTNFFRSISKHIINFSVIFLCHRVVGGSLA